LKTVRRRLLLVALLRVGVEQMFAQGPAKVAFENRQTPIAARGFAARVSAHAVFEQIDLARVVDRARLLRREPICIEREVAPIRGERVGRQAIFDPNRVDEAVDRLLARLSLRSRFL
jgi:hypothetical protein